MLPFSKLASHIHFEAMCKKLFVWMLFMNFSVLLWLQIQRL